MRKTRLVRPVIVVAAVLAAGGLVLLGHLSADTSAARNSGYQAGHDDGYSDGLRIGNAQGVQDGRALQEGNEVPAASKQPVQDAFNSGYTAGENDAFGGYDGGWALSAPYLITLESGSGQIVYRIQQRTTVLPNIDYYLCADEHHICQRAHK
jgi:hypothetical protein